MHVELMQPTVAEIDGRRKHRFPDRDRVAHVPSDDDRRQVLANRPDDLALGVKLVPAIGFADDAILEMHARDERRARFDLVGATLE